MTDRELLELAAKAAGYTIEENGKDVNGLPWYWCFQLSDNWDPLTDDGDALRLAVKLRLHIGLESHTVSAWEKDQFGNFQTEELGDDPEAATRRAITRAAAAIGEKSC